MQVVNSTGAKSVNVVGSSGSGVTQSGSTSGFTQPSYNPVQTWSPQTTISTNQLEPTVNPYDLNYGGGGVVESWNTGETGGTGAVQTAPDPYAAWGGKAAYDSLISGFSGQKDNIYGTANDAAANTGISLNGSILDFIDSLTTGQSRINNEAVNNELARKQATTGVLGMLSRGLASGGVMLASKNAGDSSAAEGLARAYGNIGQREMSKVGNQHAMGAREIALDQEELGRQQASGVRRIQDSKTMAVNNIVSDARNELAALDAAMAEASIPDRIQIEIEKENIKSQVMAALAQYDQKLTSGVANIKPTADADRRAEATRLAQAGTAPAEAFDFTTQTPAEFQNTGPFASNLPIFTFPRKRTS